MNKKFRQQYFAFRNGYQCGRCMKAGLLYEGEPHIDSVGHICEPPNDLALGGPDAGSNAENVPIVPIPPSPTNPEGRPIQVDIDDGVGKLSPINVDEHGDVVS